MQLSSALILVTTLCGRCTRSVKICIIDKSRLVNAIRKNPWPPIVKRCTQLNVYYTLEFVIEMDYKVSKILATSPASVRSKFSLQLSHFSRWIRLTFVLASRLVLAAFAKYFSIMLVMYRSLRWTLPWKPMGITSTRRKLSTPTYFSIFY